MRVVRTGKAGAENQQRHRNMVQRQLLLQLVERALEKRGGSRQHRSSAGFGDTCRERRGMFLGDAGIDIVRTRAFTEITGYAVRPGCRGGDDHQSRFVRKPGFERVHRHGAIVFTRVECRVERRIGILPVIRLALAGMRFGTCLVAAIRTIVAIAGRFVESESLGGMHMHYDRMVDVLDCAQRLHQRVHIVASLHISVVQTERFEQVQCGRAVRLAQRRQRAVHAAEILGYRHLVVIDDDDEIAALFSRVVQSLEGDRRAQRAVADHGDHIADRAGTGGTDLHIAGLRKTAGQ